MTALKKTVPIIFFNFSFNNFLFFNFFSDFFSKIFLKNISKLFFRVSFFFTSILFFFAHNSRAQNIQSSNEKNLGVEAQGYTFSGKINDRILFMYWTKSKVEVQAFDTDLHKQWDRTIELDKKFTHNILDIICGKTDFTIVDYAERKNIQYLKLAKYDSQIKLLDSATVKAVPKNPDITTPKLTLSDDKKTALLSEKAEAKYIDMCVFGFDSLKRIWDTRFDYKFYAEENKPEQFVVGNQGDVFLAFEENQFAKKGHQYKIEHFNGAANVQETIVPLDFYVLHTKFSFDNYNRKFCGAGIYTEKNLSHAQGLFTFNIPLSPENGTMRRASGIVKNIFDDDFVSAFTGKKVTNTRGLTPDLRMQDIIHRRDGGLLLIVEQVRELTRISPGSSSFGFGHRDLAITDYYNDNTFLANIEPDGKMQWRSVVVKKQTSQNDDGRYCSFFVLKTPSAIHLIFNEDAARTTIVSDYVFKPDGKSERHTILNTDGKNLQLRFRDALQIGSNELIVPSQENYYVKLVKIEL